MKKPTLIFLVFSFILSSFIQAKSPARTLETFLKSSELSQLRKAYLAIVRDQKAFVDPIRLPLESIAKAEERRSDVLHRLLYLAAMIRSEKFIPPLEEMSRDREGLFGECIYCCPIVLTLTLYGVYANWSPPGALRKPLTNGVVYNLDADIRQMKGDIGKPLVQEHSIVQFADPDKQAWFDGLRQLPEKDLIKKAGPENPDHSERYFAGQILGDVVVDSRYLSELYWLAIEELPEDASGFYRCCIYAAIERAERARAQGK